MTTQNRRKNHNGMETQAELINQLDASHQAVRALLDEIQTGAEVYAGWTIREVLAHLTGWDEAVAASLRAYAKGSEAAIAAYRGINDYNARSVETREGLNYEQTCREWELAREELKAALLALTDEQYAGELLYPWGQRGSVPGLVQIFIHHERDHADEIRGLMGKRDAV
jgi:hypothetical protein